MIIIGILLLLLAAAVIIVMVMAGNQTVSVSWDAVNLNWTPSALTVFILGAVTLLMLVLAFAALRAGARRKMAKSSELRRLRKLDSERGVTTTSTTPTTSRGGATAAPTSKTSTVDGDNRL